MRKIRKTDDQFKKEVFLLTKGEYLVLDRYHNNKVPVKFHHTSCGYEWLVAPNNFLRGTRCPVCRIKNRTKSHEEFVNQVYQSIGEEYVIIGKYKNNRTKIEIKHSECDSLFFMTPTDFLGGHRCRKCTIKESAKNRTLSHMDYVKNVQMKFGNSYTIISEYIDSKNRIIVKHNKCGHERLVLPAIFKQRGGCPYCNNKLPISENQYKGRLLKNYKGQIEYIGGFTNMNTSAKHKCKVCNYCWSGFPNDLAPYNGDRKRGCPNCNKIKMQVKLSLTHKEFVNNLRIIAGDEYCVKSRYISSKTPVLMYHNNCGYEWKVHPASFIFRKGYCPKCDNHIRSRDTKYYIKEIYDLAGDEYTLLGEYENTSKPTLMRHNRCGYEWNIRPNDFIRGQRCPGCRFSKGERRIALYLEKNEIDYRSQYTFKDCVYKGRLRFDFAVYSQNKLLGLIEYNGIQHLEPVDIFGGEEAFQELKEKDNIKKKYCLMNTISLITIQYWDYDNIENILQEWLREIQTN
ncbi:hypothetical protein [Metabacillus dongyingensis]|uniref:hypothetical protein n=1 Tax=Metabacillus dongyingensis TaxID=2874282 RepID=UPI001CBFC78F|nr:hypothetical protein [Metabacillus dongyingensis]UAL54463.1 hypothetical protein K8L98_12150 [Metabacillus dongyingensis]